MMIVYQRRKQKIQLQHFLSPEERGQDMGFLKIDFYKMLKRSSFNKKLIHNSRKCFCFHTFSKEEDNEAELMYSLNERLRNVRV